MQLSLGRVILETTLFTIEWKSDFPFNTFPKIESPTYVGIFFVRGCMVMIGRDRVRLRSGAEITTLHFPIRHHCLSIQEIGRTLCQIYSVFGESHPGALRGDDDTKPVRFRTYVRSFGGRPPDKKKEGGDFSDPELSFFVVAVREKGGGGKLAVCILSAAHRRSHREREEEREKGQKGSRRSRSRLSSDGERKRRLGEIYAPHASFSLIAPEREKNVIKIAFWSAAPIKSRLRAGKGEREDMETILESIFFLLQGQCHGRA